jgi:hypothetical protein
MMSVGSSNIIVYIFVASTCQGSKFVLPTTKENFPALHNFKSRLLSKAQRRPSRMTNSTRRYRYVNHSGSIAINRFRLQDFSLNRLTKVLIFVIILIFTNPAHMNGDGRRSTISMFSRGSKETPSLFTRLYSDLIGVELGWGKSTTWSDFILFSLQKETAGVSMGILTNQFILCENDGMAPRVCQWISTNACHGMKTFDPNYRPFTLIRILHVMKLMSFLLQWCYNGGTLVPSASGYWYGRSHSLAPLSSILSTLYQPIWYNDFIALNLLAYPCFELLDRITRVGIPDNAVSLHFYGTASLLIFIVGGFANFVAEYLTLDSVRGMNGSIASLLGYYSAAKPKRIMLNWIGMALTSGDVFFGVLILTCSCILLGFGNFLGSWRISDSIAWGVGGVLGFFICRLQLEHFYNIWSWSF